MNVFRVESVRWDYEQTAWYTRAIFTTRQAAEDYVETMKHIDKGLDWTVEEHEVWETAPERITMRVKYKNVGGRGYKVTEMVPRNWQPPAEDDCVTTVLERGA